MPIERECRRQKDDVKTQTDRVVVDEWKEPAGCVIGAASYGAVADEPCPLTNSKRKE